MTYDDELPADWTPYDRILTVVEHAREMFRMHGIPEQLKALLGPENYERMFHYLHCIDLNVEKIRLLMGQLYVTSEAAGDVHDVPMQLVHQTTFDELMTALNPHKEEDNA